jgi:hypothetical protein
MPLKPTFAPDYDLKTKPAVTEVVIPPITFTEYLHSVYEGIADKVDFNGKQPIPLFLNKSGMCLDPREVKLLRQLD